MNSETAYEIGETLRNLSWQGDSNYKQLAREAIDWFERGTLLNPFDPYDYMKLGMCLDWLERHDEAAPFFEKAVRCDPNNYYVLVHQGWHFFQVEAYGSAKQWFDRSVKMKWWDNPIAYSYLRLVERKLSKQENQNDSGKPGMNNPNK